MLMCVKNKNNIETWIIFNTTKFCDKPRNIKLLSIFGQFSFADNDYFAKAKVEYVFRRSMISGFVWRNTDYCKSKYMSRE